MGKRINNIFYIIYITSSSSSIIHDTDVHAGECPILRSSKALWPKCKTTTKPNRQSTLQVYTLLTSTFHNVWLNSHFGRESLVWSSHTHVFKTRLLTIIGMELELELPAVRSFGTLRSARITFFPGWRQHWTSSTSRDDNKKRLFFSLLPPHHC